MLIHFLSFELPLILSTYSDFLARNSLTSGQNTIIFKALGSVRSQPFVWCDRADNKLLVWFAELSCEPIEDSASYCTSAN